MASSFLFVFSFASFSFVGATIISLLLPYAFNKTLQSFVLVLHIVCSRNASIFRGLSLAIAGVVFIVLHVLVISFSVVDITKAFLGRMGAVFLVQIVLVCGSLIAGKLYRHRYKGTTDAAWPPWNRCKKLTRCQCDARLLFISATLLICGISTLAGSSAVQCRKFSAKTIAPPAVIRAMSYNVLLGHTLTGRDNSACVAKIINFYQPSVIGFQESDPLPAFWGGKDFQYAVNTRLTGYNSFAGVAPLMSSLGVSLLSKFTARSHAARLLPEGVPNVTPHYSYTKTEFEIPDVVPPRYLHVIVAHLVYRNWTKARLTEQSLAHMTELVEQVNAVEDATAPVIVMGDLNLNPASEILDLLWNNASLTSASNPDRSSNPQTTTLDHWANIDHIFYRNLKLVQKRALTLVDVGAKSDHLPVLADFELL